MCEYVHFTACIMIMLMPQIGKLEKANIRGGGGTNHAPQFFYPSPPHNPQNYKVSKLDGRGWSAVIFFDHAESIET